MAEALEVLEAAQAEALVEAALEEASEEAVSLVEELVEVGSKTKSTIPIRNSALIIIYNIVYFLRM